MTSIKDVAKLAQVSVATVSRVINNTENVQDETKERVLAAIKELNYSPNLLGRSLRRLETKKILVMLNTISNQFYSRVVKGIEEKAIPHGYTVMVCMTHGNCKIEQRYMQMLKTRLVDGAVFLTTEQDGNTLTNELSAVNVVQACEPREDFLTSTVSIDNEKAAYDSVSYLIKKGHKKIAFFGAGDIYQSSIKREHGYCKALKENNIPVNPNWIFNEGFSFNAGIRASSLLLSKGELPTAIFCISDSCAAGAMKALAQNDIKIPDDISIMGFDNTQLSQIYMPSITTLKQPQYEIGYQAMELLLNKINGTDTNINHLLLDYEIVERESVKQI
ncbi:LacI family DNA-binding transcriptional regulator [Paludicola sp. MB14-C6]|uniref:LacI family DNA-binding transcriptional regulator n=1 Tax=Paludihabitans sp. MB14-C6 TaxID=3070656 RepID=UPI0027DD9006|nr:LacI family DNA-binding transcriptional regulator [Paludicola sp. MB14-C6]WMJ21975.1 LacI family DNA-binding transcriptional regulator [Paludicola sp. MB14-C6]